MSLDSASLLIEQIVITMMTTDAEEQGELASLFAKLQLMEPGPESQSVENEIWEIWCHHEEPEAVEAMEQVVEALSRGSLADANEGLNRMVRRWPTWAEAWNKRATAYYLIGDYLKSAEDIERTLELEPRHFGALSGLGLIMVALGNEEAAINAFEATLAIHPFAEGARQNLETLRARQQQRTI